MAMEYLLHLILSHIFKLLRENKKIRLCVVSVLSKKDKLLDNRTSLYRYIGSFIL